MSSKFGKYVYNFGMMVMLAVLLSFVAMVGLFLVVGNRDRAGDMLLLAVLTFVVMAVARGRRANTLARRSAASPPAPPTYAPRAVVTVQTEAWFIRENGVRTPLGESFGVLVDY
jgi:hypothetical protein